MSLYCTSNSPAIGRYIYVGFEVEGFIFIFFPPLRKKNSNKGEG